MLLDSEDNSATAKKVSVIILNYNGVEHIDECLSTVLNQTYPHYDVIIVDSASSEFSVNYIRSKYPDITLLPFKENLGYARGNNIGIEHADSDYVAILNNDTIVESEWIEELVKTLQSRDNVCFVTSKLKIYNDRDIINARGIVIHYTGPSFNNGLFECDDDSSALMSVPGINGCAFAARRDVLKEIGLFDADFFMHMEDADISLRARLAGYDILYVPTSVVYHKYKLNIGSNEKFYRLERNRYLLLLKNYSTRTIVVLLPALLLTELMIIGYTLIWGRSYMSSKLKVLRWLYRNRELIRDKRAQVQKLRRVDDIKVLAALGKTMPANQLSANSYIQKGVEAFNFLFKGSYSLLKCFL